MENFNSGRTKNSCLPLRVVISLLLISEHCLINSVDKSFKIIYTSHAFDYQVQGERVALGQELAYTFLKNAIYTFCTYIEPYNIIVAKNKQQFFVAVFAT